MRTSTYLLWLVAPIVSIAVALAVWPLSARAETPDPLANPVANGAWLYAGHCQRCHGDYDEARLAEALSTKELRSVVSGDARPGCKVAWSIANGGPLLSKDIGALVAYMTAWEEAGAQPALPPLPLQPIRTPTPAPTVITTGAEKTAAASASPTPTPLAPELLAAFAADPVAHGAWLYTRNCQRCHQTYATARIGQGLDTNLLKQRIQEATQAATCRPSASAWAGRSRSVRSTPSLPLSQPGRRPVVRPRCRQRWRLLSPLRPRQPQRPR